MPPVDSSEIAHQSDLVALETSLRAEIGEVRAELRAFTGKAPSSTASLVEAIDDLFFWIVLANFLTMTLLAALVFTIARSTA